jgi:iron complex transport system permease protein
MSPTVEQGHEGNRAGAGTAPALRLTIQTSVGSAGPALIGSVSTLSPARWFATMAWLLLGSLGGFLVCLQFGAERIGLAEAGSLIWGSIVHGRAGLESSGAAATILLDVRLPRLAVSFLVGGTLATVGVGLQALLRNPLADPYVLGISSGAALGAAVAMLLGVGTAAGGMSALTVSAFVGGLLAILLVYRIAIRSGHLPMPTLLLAGVIITAICSALVMFITSILDPARAYTMISWLMGTMSAPDTTAFLFLIGVTIGGGVALFRQARSLNVLTLGEETARSLGVEVERVKHTIFLLSALMTGAVVSVSGLIGFVGMVIPHAVRMALGADHRIVMPASALIGGLFLMVADTVARTALAPAEIPVGVVTALVGGPFFVYLLVARRSAVS